MWSKQNIFYGKSVQFVETEYFFMEQPTLSEKALFPRIIIILYLPYLSLIVIILLDI